VSALTEKAPAKINLTLRVVGRRADGYHELESLVAFADLADTLTLRPAPKTALEISGAFAAACGPAANNLVLKAVAALGERIGPVQSGHFELAKEIPVAAGLGGGSADAAAALRLLARANGLALSDPRLAATALALGADVPVCLDPHARIMRGIGEVLSAPLALPRLDGLLVNPGVALPTREVFAKFAGRAGSKRRLGQVPGDRKALIAFLAANDNDLTPAAIACAPVIAVVLAALRALPGVLLARMAGSGPTCFAIFASPSAAADAARAIEAGHKDWWVRNATIG
jgi:4-diphosphocytidyl-2-C-methyl-D-erythritol kinase